MDMNIEQHVRQRAYELWQMTGMVEGRAHDHWIAAEQEVLYKPMDAKQAAKSQPKARKPRAAKSKA